MTQYIADEAHFKEVIARVPKVKRSLWIGTADIKDLYVDDNNKIRITLRNTTRDLVLTNVNYIIECFDMAGNPFVCNKDGESTFFDGSYPNLLEPRNRSVHGAFFFRNYAIDRLLGGVRLTIISWTDENGVTWTIPEDERIPKQWDKYGYRPGGDE